MEREAWVEDQSRAEGPRSTRPRRAVQGGFVVCPSLVPWWAGSAAEHLEGKGRDVLLRVVGGSEEGFRA